MMHQSSSNFFPNATNSPTLVANSQKTFHNSAVAAAAKLANFFPNAVAAVSSLNSFSIENLLASPSSPRNTTANTIGHNNFTLNSPTTNKNTFPPLPTPQTDLYGKKNDPFFITSRLNLTKNLIKKKLNLPKKKSELYTVEKRHCFFIYRLF